MGKQQTKKRKYNNNATTTKEKKRSVSAENQHPPRFQEEHFNSMNGFMTTVWGPCIWFFLHTMSFNYPTHPTKEQKKQYMEFILSLQHILPCGKCRKNLTKNMSALPLTMERMENRGTFSRYIYELHEQVNTMLKKKSNLTYEDVRTRFENFRARCNNKKKTMKVKKENGCTEPILGNIKSKCIIKIIPKNVKCKTLDISNKCIPK